MEKLSVIKIGGNVIDDAIALNRFLADFAQIGGSKILVHGGGKIASALSKRLGITPKMIQGRRITDKHSLDAVTMVYAGLINKNIISTLQGFSCNAMGMTGADGNSVLAVKRPVQEIDYGYVGDLTTDSVNKELLSALIDQSLTPVLSAITHDGKGQLLNTNADTLAATIAIALSTRFEVSLLYCFEKKGVLRTKESDGPIFKELTFRDFKKLIGDGTVTEGMIPKLQNAFEAARTGVKTVRIGHAEDVKKLGRTSFGTQLNYE